MIEQQIQTLCDFHAQKWHAPITLMTKEIDIHGWHEVGVAVYANAERDSAFCKDLVGDSIVMEGALVGKVSPTWLVLYSAPRVDITSNILDQHLPRMCRAFRKGQRESLIETMQWLRNESMNLRSHYATTSMNSNDSVRR